MVAKKWGPWNQLWETTLIYLVGMFSLNFTLSTLHLGSVGLDQWQWWGWPDAADICGSHSNHCKIAKSPLALHNHSLVQGKKTLILIYCNCLDWFDIDLMPSRITSRQKVHICCHGFNSILFDLIWFDASIWPGHAWGEEAQHSEVRPIYVFSPGDALIIIMKMIIWWRW